MMRRAGVWLLLALSGCNSMTVDLVSKTTGDPLDAVGRVLALPYAVVADVFTLGNGKAFQTPKRTRAAARAPDPADDGPASDMLVVAKQALVEHRVVVDRKEYARFAGENLGARRARCDDRGACEVHSRLKCEMLPHWLDVPRGFANNLRDALEFGGAQAASVRDSGENEVSRVWTVSDGMRSIAMTRIGCDDNDRVETDFWFEVPVEFSGE